MLQISKTTIKKISTISKTTFLMLTSKETTMYMIFKGNIPQGNKKHESYEAARRAARKWIRAKNSISVSNPSISEYGYRIVKVSNE